MNGTSEYCLKVFVLMSFIAPRRDGDEGREYMIECSERFLSIGDAVVNGYKEDQDLACTHYLHTIESIQLPINSGV